MDLTDFGYYLRAEVFGRGFDYVLSFRLEYCHSICISTTTVLRDSTKFNISQVTGDIKMSNQSIKTCRTSVKSSSKRLVLVQVVS